MLGGKERMEYENHVDGALLEQVSKFKYLEFILDESGTDVAEYHRKMASRKKVTGAIRSLINVKGL